MIFTQKNKAIILKNRTMKTDNTVQIKLREFFRRIITSSSEAPKVLQFIERRLSSTNRVRQPVKISRIVSQMQDTSKTAVVVAKVLDDETMLNIPALNIIALRWSHSVQKKIEAAGGSISTLDQFMKVAGSIDNLQVIHKDHNERKSAKYWGPAPGEKGSTTYPRANHKIKQKERRKNVKKPLRFVPESEE